MVLFVDEWYLTKLTYFCSMKYLIFLCIVLSSCSSAYHFKKFISKGGKIDTLERVETITETLRINGKDSIITLRVPVACPDPVIPPTRQEIRYKYKLQHDSIETVRYVTKWKTKREIKEVKAEHRSNWYVWLLIGLVIGYVIKLKL